MRFMMIVKSDAQSEAGVMPSEQLLSEMGAYNEQLVKAGVMLAGEGLQPSSKGTRVRLSGGKFAAVNGPFTEAKELVAGYWLIQTKTKEEAIEWAKRVPGAEGEIELRPLYELTDFPADPAEQAGGWRDQEQSLRDDAAAAPAARRPGTQRFMQFLLADQWTEKGTMAGEKVMAEMGALVDDMNKAGVWMSGEGLKPSSEGVRVRFDGKKRTVIDGPFTESKELIAGYSMIQVPSKAEAVEWTKRFLRIHVEGTGVGEGVCGDPARVRVGGLPGLSRGEAGWLAQQRATASRRPDPLT